MDKPVAGCYWKTIYRVWAEVPPADVSAMTAEGWIDTSGGTVGLRPTVAMLQEPATKANAEMIAASVADRYPVTIDPRSVPDYSRKAR